MSKNSEKCQKLSDSISKKSVKIKRKMEANEKFPEFKIVFVGDSAVGKTSIIMRYHHNSFSAENQPTIGAAFISKTVVSPNGKCVIHIWDTAGQERYKSLVPMYARGASIAIIVFDTSDPDCFNGLEEWVRKVKEDMSSDCQVLIAGNKCDLEQKFNKDEIDDWTKKNNFPLVYVSAKTGQGIDILFSTAISFLPKAKFLMHNGNENPVFAEQKKQKKCC